MTNPVGLPKILIDLFTGGKDASVTLSGGCRLDWNDKAKTLTATRLNRGLELRPRHEQTVFERVIQTCGYKCGKSTEYVRLATPGGLNQRIGIRWTISKTPPTRKQKATGKAEAQESMF